MSQSGTMRVHVGLDPGKWWIVALVGAALVIVALIMFANLMAATIISTLLFGALLIVAGAFQVVHAFSERGWGGFLLSLLVGLLYLATGVTLYMNPIAGSLALTLLLAAFLLASGFVRILLAFRFWHMWGWLLLLSGVVGILAGLVIMTGFPATGLWVLGFMLAVDLFVHGLWWLSFAFLLRAAH